MTAVSTPIATLRIAIPAMAAFTVMGMVWGTFAAILPDLMTMLGVDEARLGLLLFLTPLAAVLAMFAAPAFGAGLGRWALPISTFLMGLSIALPGQAASVWLFPVAMMACGAATGLTDVLMNARVATLENAHQKPLMNLCHAVYSFGFATAAICTGVLRDAGLTPGIVMAIMSTIGILMSLVTWDRGGLIEGLDRPKDKRIAKLGLIPLIGGAMVMIAFMTENAAESWSALHIEQTLGGSPAQGAFGPAALALTMGFARLAGQGLISRFSPYTLLRSGAVLAAIGALIAALAQSPALAYAGFTIMGIGASVIAPTAFSLVGQLASPQARARAVARATLIGYFGYFIGPPLLGFIAGHVGLRAAFVAAACGLIAIMALAPLMKRAAR